MKGLHASVVMTLTTAALTFTGCAEFQGQPPTMTPLEIQSMQTREYESPKKTVFASVMSVLQDLGYTINGADRETGFITAESATQNATGGVEIFHGILSGTHSILSGTPATQSIEQTAATAFIEEIGDRTRVRLNFVTKRQSSSAQGQTTRRDTPILDVQVYTNAFERIENAVFIRSGD